MLFDFLFKDSRRRAALVAEAAAKAQPLKLRRDSLKDAQLFKLQRQVDLWSISSLDTDREEEYFKVTHLIAELVKEIAAIDEYMEDLREASHTCEDSKKCEKLEQLLLIQDPWAEKIKLGTQDNLPRTPAS